MMNDIRNQLGKLTTTVGMLQQEKGKFPTQPQPNPQTTSTPPNSQGLHFASSSVTFPEQVKAIISLRRGKTVDNQVVMPPEPSYLPPPIDRSIPTSTLGESPKEASKEVSKENGNGKGKVKEQSVPDPQVIPTPAPFPNPYIPGLKDPVHLLWTSNMSSSSSSSINIPNKHRGIDNYTEGIDNNGFSGLGNARVSITDAKVINNKAVRAEFSADFHGLGLGEMKPTRVTLQLADRSVRVPREVVEDVLVQVDQFVYLVDFVILDTNPTDSSAASTPVILGRPFLATADAIINCRNRLLNMTFGNMKMEVNVFNVGSQMGDDENIHEVSLIDTLVEEHVDELLYSDPLEVALTAEEAEFLESSDVSYLYSLLKDGDEAYALNAWTPKFEEFEELPSIEKKVLPSPVDPPLYDDPGGKRLTAKVILSDLLYLDSSPEELLLAHEMNMLETSGVYYEDPLAKSLTTKEMDAEVDYLYSLLTKQDAYGPIFEELATMEAAIVPSNPLCLNLLTAKEMDAEFSCG
ncbi:uncharacterized protein LOC131328561 [Rhododendron vialii]|uniref:uncharacterized protein LOC131328561 n=1 Tax=Rhododendron vialii TaxID=182163 RepID=UPI00265FEA9E|nr:uncharacterized protein LOC131328561 [Rhododendron vialii]